MGYHGTMLSAFERLQDEQDREEQMKEPDKESFCIKTANWEEYASSRVELFDLIEDALANHLAFDVIPT